jgi:arsenate reductase (glutaredoxin)
MVTQDKNRLGKDAPWRVSTEDNMIKIYHNPSCKKSRAGLQYLKESGKAFTIVEYIKNPLTEKELEKLLMKLNLKPADLLRTQEDYYKLNLRGKRFEDHEMIKIILENPKLMQRPVVEGAYKAVVGDPVENIAILLK